MISKIQNIEPTSTGKGWRVTLEGGEQVYVFNQSFFNLIQVGAQVDLSLQKQGRWTHVIGVAPSYYGGTPGAPAPVPGTATPVPTPAPMPAPQPGTPVVDVANQPGGGAIPGATPPVATPPLTNTPPAPFDKDSMIVRQAILKSPVLAEMFKELTDETKNIDGVIELVKKLEAYVYSGGKTNG